MGDRSVDEMPKCKYYEPGMLSEATATATAPATIDYQLAVIVKDDKADKVNRPSHYAGNGIETIDALKGIMSDEEFNGFLKGNIVKYVTRAGKKDAVAQDLNKVVWYASFLYLSNGGSVEGLFRTAEYMKARFK